MAFTVKAVADLAGVSVRTLHHYDEIGLLQPAQSTASGYRLYTDTDLERLQQVLFFRELGFGLQEIRAIIDRPGFDRKRALQEHRKLLVERQQRIERLIQSVDRTLSAMERGTDMADKKGMFDGFDQNPYEEEARQRWGHTDAWKESQQKTKGYSKNDWAAIQQEAGAITMGIADRMDRDPSDPEVQEFVRQWHEHINARYYTCPVVIFRNLGDMYVADERFTAFYDKVKPGLAQFMQAAMTVYCDRLEGQ